MGVKPGHSTKISETNCWHLRCTVTKGSYISVGQRKTNCEICDKLRIEKDLLQRAIQRKLRLFGHIHRMEDNRKLKTLMMFWIVDRTNKRGRPCTEWMDDTVRCVRLDYKSWTVWPKIAEDGNLLQDKQYTPMGAGPVVPEEEEEEEKMLLFPKNYLLLVGHDCHNICVWVWLQHWWCSSVYCVTFAESEPYCCSRMFVCLFVCLMFVRASGRCCCYAAAVLLRSSSLRSSSAAA